MLMLISNASRRQYRRDLLNLVCLPRGGRISYSYRTKWIQESLRDHRLKEYEGKKALVVFCDTYLETVGHDFALQQLDEMDFSAAELAELENDVRGKDFVFVPVRYVSIVSVIQDGDAYSIEVELGDWYRLDFNSSNNNSKLSEFSDRLNRSEISYPKPDQPRDDWVFVSDDDSDVVGYREGKAGRFTSVATQLAKHRQFDDSIFCCPVSCGGQEDLINGAEPTSLLDAPLSPKNGPLPEFDVKGNTHRDVCVYVVSGRNADAAEIALKSSDPMSTIMHSNFRQRGGGCVIRYRVVLLPSLRQRNVQLTLSAGSASGKLMAPEFFAHLKVAPALKWLYVAGLLFVVGNLLLAVDLTLVVTVLGGQVGGASLPQGSIGLLVAAKALGLLITAAGAGVALSQGVAKYLDAS